jgi:DNA-directed RNA polymerase
MIKIFNDQGNEKLSIPKHHSKMTEIPKFPNEKLDREEYLKFSRQRDATMKKHSEIHSLWCTELYRLSIANKVNPSLNFNHV